MSDDSYKVQASISSPPSAQYAKGSMINFRGDTVDEVFAQLDEAINKGLLAKVVEADKVLLVESGVGPAAVGVAPSAEPPFPVDGATVTQTVAPVVPIQQAGTPVPMCQHGKRQWKEGPNGKWYAWFCPTPKNTPGQCDPIWAKADGSPK